MGDLSSEQIQIVLIFVVIGLFVVIFPLYDHYATKGNVSEHTKSGYVNVKRERKNVWKIKYCAVRL